MITFETFEHRTGIEEIAIIHNENGSYISMPKAVWDELEAAKEITSSEE